MADSFRVISRLHANMTNFIARALAKEAEGLVASHGSILFMLFGGREASMQEIAWEIDKTPQTVTVLVNKLIRHGYACRRKNDRDSRSYLIRLTEKGESFRPYFENVSQQLYDCQYRNFTDEEKNTLRILLGKMERNFQKI